MRIVLLISSLALTGAGEDNSSKVMLDIFAIPYFTKGAFHPVRSCRAEFQKGPATPNHAVVVVRAFLLSVLLRPYFIHKVNLYFYLSAALFIGERPTLFRN
jgi:hypothetical protein